MSSLAAFYRAKEVEQKEKKVFDFKSRRVWTPLRQCRTRASRTGDEQKQKRITLERSEVREK